MVVVVVAAAAAAAAAAATAGATGKGVSGGQDSLSSSLLASSPQTRGESGMTALFCQLLGRGPPLGSPREAHLPHRRMPCTFMASVGGRLALAVAVAVAVTLATTTYTFEEACAAACLRIGPRR